MFKLFVLRLEGPCTGNVACFRPTTIDLDTCTLITHARLDTMRLRTRRVPICLIAAGCSPSYCGLPARLKVSFEVGL